AVRRVQRAEARKRRRDAVGARRLELLDPDDQRVTGLGALDVEGPRLRVVVAGQLHLRRELPRLRHGAVVAVLRPGHDPGARLDAMGRRHAAEGVFQLLVLRHVAQNRLLAGESRRKEPQRQSTWPETEAHGATPPVAGFYKLAGQPADTEGS